MIEFRNLYPTQEEFIFGIERAVSMANEALKDVEMLTNRYMAGEFYITEIQLAEWLGCSVEELPTIPHKISIGKHHLWKKADVEEYLESKRK